VSRVGVSVFSLFLGNESLFSCILYVGFTIEDSLLAPFAFLAFCSFSLTGCPVSCASWLVVVV
jgi:hypothetical protein